MSIPFPKEKIKKKKNSEPELFSYASKNLYI